MPIQKKECVHSMSRRSRNHDYTRGFYHIVMLKNPAVSVPCFGIAMGDPDLLSCMGGSAIVKLSPLGLIINKEISALKKAYPQLVVYATAVMPDHLHLVLQLKPGYGISLGDMVAIFKTRCTRCADIHADGDFPLIPVFKEKFTDRIIYNQPQLAAEIRYVLDNPHRQRMLAKYPDYFRRRISINAGDVKLYGFGNPFLSEHPMRFAVRVRSAWSDREFEIYKEKCMILASQGGIAVSPFISGREKIIRDAVIEIGGKIIRMLQENISDRYKPSGKEFELCGEGRLLLLCEETAPEYRNSLTRDEALRLNELCIMMETHHITEPA